MFPPRCLRIMLLTGSSFLAATAARADCPQELAVYENTTENLSIQFRKLEDWMPKSHEFSVRMDDIALDGSLMARTGEPHPFGMIFNQCPDGDVTDEELLRCTVWSGVIYDISAVGAVKPLPDVGAEAAIQLLLSDFGAWFRNSAFYRESGLDIAPSDVFRLTGCQE